MSSYATNGGISRADMSSDPAWIEITDEQYAQALAGVMDGKLISIEGGFAMLDDHRQDELWVAHGQRYILGEDREGQNYDGWGPIPEWLYTEEPATPEPTLAELRESKQVAVTAKRWEIMTGGITVPSGVVVGTTIDDQNRITSVVANAALAGLSDADEVNFKAASGWVRITIGDIKQIAGAIGQFVQDCYTAERAHHDAIAALPDDRAAINAYDVSVGWPA